MTTPASPLRELPQGSVVPQPARQSALSRGGHYLRGNSTLSIGVALLIALLLFAVIGRAVYGTEAASPLSVPVNARPGAAYPFGTDSQGRDMLSAMIAGTPLTLQIGLIAGLIGTAIGTLLAFISGLYGGAVDTFIKTTVDVGLTVPSLVILIIIAVSVRGNMSIMAVALVVSATAWLWPTRSMRSQVLSMRDRGYVQVARLSGMGGLEIITREMMPNLAPFIAASLVNSVAQAVLASIGLEALGLGAMDAPTLGMSVYWAIYNSALLANAWWVWAPPIVVIVVLFLGLFLLSVGTDKATSPRLRTAS